MEDEAVAVAEEKVPLRLPLDSDCCVAGAVDCRLVEETEAMGLFAPVGVVAVGVFR
jgi:hypothetical protein